jgi:hypothetical protein
MARDYARLKELLQSQETFPHLFTYKFIGRNSPGFAAAVAGFEKNFPALKLEASRLSKGDGHVALTYKHTAGSAEEIVFVFEAIARLPDLLVIL